MFDGLEGGIVYGDNGSGLIALILMFFLCLHKFEYG